MSVYVGKLSLNTRCRPQRVTSLVTESRGPGRSGPLRPTDSHTVKLYSQDFSGLAIHLPTSVSQQETFRMFLHLFVPCPVAFQNQRCGSSVIFPVKITPDYPQPKHCLPILMHMVHVYVFTDSSLNGD